jgi:hypothetical protein
VHEELAKRQGDGDDDVFYLSSINNRTRTLQSTDVGASEHTYMTAAMFETTPEHGKEISSKENNF